jgi:hypothetical protein
MMLTTGRPAARVIWSRSWSAPLLPRDEEVAERDELGGHVEQPWVGRDRLDRLPRFVDQDGRVPTVPDHQRGIVAVEVRRDPLLRDAV